MNGKKTKQADMQCEEAVVDLDLLGDKIQTDGGLVPELVVDVTAHTKPRNRSPISTENWKLKSGLKIKLKYEPKNMKTRN